MQQDFLVNTVTAGWQSTPVITKLAAGGWVVIWGSDANSGDLRGQMYDAAGAKVGGEFAATAATTGSQNSPTVAATPDGGFLLTWLDSGTDGYDIHAQKFSSAGARVGGEINVPTSNADYQLRPNTSVAADGSYLVSWDVETATNHSHQSWVARYDATGAKSGADVNVTSLTGIGGDWLALSSGHYVTAYSTGSDVYARFVDVGANGALQAGTPFKLNAPDQIVGTAYAVSLVRLSDGSFAAAWTSYINSNGFFSTFGIGSRTFDATGAVGAPVVVSDSDPFNSDVHLAALADGYIVSWGGYSDDSVNTTKSYARVFDNSGDAIGGRFDVNVSTVSAYAGAEFIGLANGGFVGVFGANGDIRMHTFDAPTRLDGLSGDDVLTATSESTPTELNGHDGNDTLNGFVSSDELHGGNGNDIANGGGGDDFISGDAGGDTLNGGAGNDKIFAAQPGIETVNYPDPVSGLDRGTEIDTLNGGDGDDQLSAGRGDNVDGGAGADTLFLSVRNATSGVHIDLSTMASQVVAGGTIVNVEMLGRFEGSDFADTVVAGTADSLGYATWPINGSVYGFGGNDVLTGGFYAPQLFGGDGDDKLTAGNNTNVSQLVGGAGADILVGGAANDLLTSADGTDTGIFFYYYGTGISSPIPVFDHGSEIDTLSGGGGDDTLIIGWGDSADGGSQGSQGDTLLVSFYGATAGVTIDFATPNQTYNFGGGTVTGFEKVNWVEGSNFADTISFGYTPGSGVGAVMMGGQNVSAGGGNDHILAGYYTQYIDGGDGDDIIDGRGQYFNYASGGAGDDTITTGSATVFGGDGRDTINAGGGTIFGDAGDDLITVSGTASNVSAQGGAGNDEIHAGSGGGTYQGNAGADTLIGGTGNDNLYSNGVSVDPNTGQSTVLDDTGIEHDVLTGGDGDDRIAIGYGDDADGGAGSDTLVLSLAGAGTGVVVNTSAIVGGGTLAIGGGTIKGFESVLSVLGTDYADQLAAGIQTGPITLNGGGGDDVLAATSGTTTMNGGDGDDRIISGTGADFMNGGAGIDIAEFAGLVNGVTVRLDTGIGPNGDRLISIESVVGTGFADTIVGNSVDNFLSGLDGDDRIEGGAGNDILIGGGGKDQLVGGTGDDTFFVDRQDDLVFENAGEGVDTVVTTANFYLYANIENLAMAQGTANIFGVGNELDNELTGNDGANTLLAGAGADTVHGGTGVDIIYGEDGNDHLFGDADNDFLAGGKGDDVMDGGTGGDSLYGEAGNDTLTGGSDFVFDQLVGGDGNDILHGDSGLADYDYLYGNAGDDSFYVDTGDDLTFEQAGEGTDTVYANVPGENNGVYLYANIENLVLLGTTRFGVGNELANRITGNDVTNLLLGGDGNDTLNGKGGNDVLFGQGGADTFVFEHGTGGDVIGDFTAGTDKIDLTAIGYSWTQVQNSMHQNGGDLAIDLGNGDLIVLQGVNASQLHQSDFILAGGASATAPLPAMLDPGAIAATYWHGHGSLMLV